MFVSSVAFGLSAFNLHSMNLSDIDVAAITASRHGHIMPCVYTTKSISLDSTLVQSDLDANFLCVRSWCLYSELASSVISSLVASHTPDVDSMTNDGMLSKAAAIHLPRLRYRETHPSGIEKFQHEAALILPFEPLCSSFCMPNSVSISIYVLHLIPISTAHVHGIISSQDLCLWLIFDAILSFRRRYTWRDGDHLSLLIYKLEIIS